MFSIIHLLNIYCHILIVIITNFIMMMIVRELVIITVMTKMKMMPVGVSLDPSSR